MTDLSQDSNTLYPFYEDEAYWQYLMEEAEWYGKQEDVENFLQQNILDEIYTSMDGIIH